MREVADELRAWRQAGDPVAIATVVDTWGSSPRPLGSRMLVSRSGRMAGSVSNGCIEGAVFEQAQEVLAAGRARHVEYGVADDVAFEVGLACGGHIEVFIQPAAGVHDRALELLAAERPFVLTTDLRSGATELEEREPDAELPRRDGDRFVEPFARPAHMVVIGAIHIAIPLHRLARVMGYRVTVVDARGQFATRERFPEADEILVQWPDEALAGMIVDRSTAVVVLTHDPKFDMPALRAALPTRAGYIGAIGSRRTNQNRLDALRAEGFSEEQLARVHGPIGLDLGGRGAEETAL
ncbi:MAG TPA: XdhC/CoxI family protein, partial [Candidatus Eisenbacteria bacterium]|nr:XdhC/CoxI family protein [Candidatus Eisenbacteria bacterium]